MSRNRSRNNSANSRRSPQEPESGGLTTIQVEAFREVFSLFVINGGGIIDALDLHSALKSVGIHLTKDEIEDVLCVMDKDGSGEVGFEEFLTLMTSTEKYLEALGGEKEQKESLLFSALTKFMMNSALSSLSAIERYYNAKAHKSPHVIAHYTAGARLIGLTEKQMTQHLATLNQSNSDSPYAQPVSLSGMARNPHKKGKIKLRIVHRKSGNTDEITTDGEKVRDVTMKPLSITTIAKCGRPLSHKSTMSLRPQISVKLPGISMRSKNPTQLTVEDLPTIRSQVQMARHKFYTEQQKGIYSVKRFADMSYIPHRLQLQYLLILTAYNVRPANIPGHLRLYLAQQKSWHLG